MSETYVAGRVGGRTPGGGRGGHDVLPASLRYGDDRAAPLLDPLVQGAEEAVRTIQGQGHLGDQHEVGQMVGQRCVAPM